MSPKPYGMPRSVVGAAKVRKFNHWLEPIKLSVHETRAGLRTIRTEMFRWPQSSPQRREGCAYLKVATLKSDYNAGHPGRIN
jgi:transposase